MRLVCPGPRSRHQVRWMVQGSRCTRARHAFTLPARGWNELTAPSLQARRARLPMALVLKDETWRSGLPRNQSQFD